MSYESLLILSQWPTRRDCMAMLIGWVYITLTALYSASAGAVKHDQEAVPVNQQPSL